MANSVEFSDFLWDSMWSKKLLNICEFHYLPVYDFDLNGIWIPMGQHMVNMKMCELSIAENHNIVLNLSKNGRFDYSVGR